MLHVRVAMLVMNPCVTDSRVRNEAWSLGRAGHAVTVFALATDEHPAGTISEDGYHVRRLDVSNRWEALTPWPIKKALTRRRFATAAIAAVRAWAPQVVHAHDLETLRAGAIIARRSGTSLVYDSHELWRHRYAHGFIRRTARWIDGITERRLIESADLVITVGSRIADWLADTYHIDRPIVVRNVPKLTNPSAKTRGLRSLAGLGSADRIIVYTGKVMGGRGLGLTIDALALLPDHFHLVMLGGADQSEWEVVETRAAQRGVNARIHRVGPVAPDEVTPTIADADVAVVLIEPLSLSYAWSLPNKLFQAVQAGVPIVTTDDLPETAEYVAVTGTGVVVERTAHGVAKGIAAVATSHQPETATDLDWDSEVARLLDWYEVLP